MKALRPRVGWGAVRICARLSWVVLALACQRGETNRRIDDAGEVEAGAADSGDPTDASRDDSAVPDTGDGSSGPTDAGPLDDDSGSIEPAADESSYVAGGASYAPLQSKFGLWVLLTRTAQSTSTLQLHAESLPQAGRYRASLHRLPCDAADGGELYRIDPTRPADAANTVEHTFTAHADLSADETSTIQHRLRPDAQSLVLEGPLPATTRLACASIRPTPQQGSTFSGPLVPFREADDIDREISGSASVRDGTVRVEAHGLREERRYAPAVVYALPCKHALAAAAESGLDAMDHQAYRLDPTLAALGQNQVALTINALGHGLRGSIYLRLDAQSLVMFRKDQGKDLPIACADLTHEGQYPDFVTHNNGGEPYPVVVELTRYRTGTKLEASVSFIGGAQAKATFKLQRRSCNGHGADEVPYVIDPAAPATDAGNRIELEAFGTGKTHSITVDDHVARVDALSLYVLTPSYSPRCLDLF